MDRQGGFSHAATGIRRRRRPDPLETAALEDRAVEELGWVPELPFDAYYTGIIGNIIMFGIGLTLGKLMPSNKENLDDLTLWTRTSDSK